MSRKRIVKITSLLLALAVCISMLPIGNVQAKSKSKTYYYGASCFEKSKVKTNAKDKWGVVYKVKFSKNKMTVCGSLNKSEKKYSQSRQFMKSKKRTLKLSKNVKCYAVGGEDAPKRVSKEFIAEVANSHNGLYLLIKVKNGKVVSVSLRS